MEWYRLIFIIALKKLYSDFFKQEPNVRNINNTKY
jgi:hypothetical protein